MNNDNEINYVELPTKDIESTKNFFASVFGWSFKDFGDEYAVVINGGVKAGFYKSEQNASVAKGSVLIVIYCRELKDIQVKVTEAGGSIVKPVFEFPGGYRFHFTGPSGNEYGVWSEKNL